MTNPARGAAEPGLEDLLKNPVLSCPFRAKLCPFAASAILGACLSLVALGSLATNASSAEDQIDLQPVPTTCGQLDEQLVAPAGLGPFLLHGLAHASDLVAKLDTPAACTQIENLSRNVSGLVGIASYCDTQSLLKAGSTITPIYKRLATALRSMGNDIHSLAGRTGCWRIK